MSRVSFVPLFILLVLGIAFSGCTVTPVRRKGVITKADIYRCRYMGKCHKRIRGRYRYIPVVKYF